MYFTKTNRKALRETALFILFFILAFLSMMSLTIMLVEKPSGYPFLLGSVKISFVHFFMTYVISTPLGLKLFFLYYKMRKESDIPKLIEKEHILELTYSKDEWLKYKKAEYDKKIKKRDKKLFFIAAVALIVLFVLYLMQPVLPFIILHVALMFYIPIQKVASKHINEEIYNNIKREKYSVKIYSKGFKVNDWYYPYNYRYKRYTDYLKLINVEIIEQTDYKYLKFSREAQIFVLVPDGASGDLKGVGTINIPLLERHKIDLVALKKELNIIDKINKIKQVVAN